MVLLPAVSWPWVPAWGSLEPSRPGGENAQKTRKKGEKMGEIWPEECGQGRDRRDHLDRGELRRLGLLGAQLRLRLRLLQKTKLQPQKQRRPRPPSRKRGSRGTTTQTCMLVFFISQAQVFIDLHCVDRSRNAQWDNDTYRGPHMGACTEATLAPHAATAAHRQPLAHRAAPPSPAATDKNENKSEGILELAMCFSHCSNADPRHDPRGVV